MNWQTKLKRMIDKGATLEEAYFLLHKLVNKNNPTFYDTVVASKEWKEWEQEAYKQGFDYAEAQECGWLSPEHFEAFLKFVKEGKVMVCEHKWTETVEPNIFGCFFCGEYKLYFNSK